MASSKNKADNKEAAKADNAAASTPSKADASAPAKKAAAKDAAKEQAKKKDKPKAKKGGKPGFGTRVKNYFSDVRVEVKRVVWPSKQELFKYSVAVVVMLIFFGLLIYLADSIILPLLYAFSGLRG